MVVKGENRDTAWFAMTDDDWPRIKAGMERWLDPANFDGRTEVSEGDVAAAERAGQPRRKAVEVFYNSACPVCDAGVTNSVAHAKRNAGDWPGPT